jgi:putative methionine-R-sulfoxide reductase with GAF domain
MMATYDVFVPAKKGSEMPDLSIKVEASNWLVALKESLKQIGDQGDSLANIVCETAEDGSLRVADPGNRRVFVIKQLESAGDEAMSREADERAANSRRVAEMADLAKKETESRLKEVETQMTSAPQAQQAEQALEAERQAAAAKMQALEAEQRRLQEELTAAKAKAEQAAKTAADEATGVLGSVKVEKRAKSAAAVDEWDDLDDWYDGDEQEESELDSAVADLFLATDNLHEKEGKEAARIVLALANKYVNAEAASVFYSDMNSALKDLEIVAASGPVGDKILGIRVPLGKGIVGFSVINGVNLTVSNVDKNPNFYGALDKEFGFKTRSILCVPVQHEDRTYGAIELVNKEDWEGWTTFDTNVLESLGRVLGAALDVQSASGGD